ncbi:MAG: glycerol-3-phosphate dehydrogenase [Proteobacteria bacterium]|nr:glycerol-3-phosphate dehydrogenase [Pseudomonadota bacterium]
MLVIGGGINGAGIARDAAGRGLSVVLCEQGDLGCATSSASSKLIHGGLRYLEHYKFGLVRESLAEREVLLNNAPHLIFPLRFVLPHTASQRPAWLIRAGLFLYDHLGGRRHLPGSRRLDLATHPAGVPLRPEFTRGFAYSDCSVDDSRLVVLNALGAAELGATIRPRTRCESARRDGAEWLAALRDLRSGAQTTVRARILVNATGPWTGRVLERTIGIERGKRPRLVKGSHIVVQRQYDGAHAYLLQNVDRRIVFVIPYERGFTLIGTTEVPFDGDPAEARIDAAETAYLCAAVGRFFTRPVTPDDVLWSFAGVRPLFDDASEDPAAVTREYVLDLDAGPEKPPLLSVFGGKITTFRKLAEEAGDMLCSVLGHDAKTWTAGVALPGGDIANAKFDAFADTFAKRHAWLPAALARRYARAYGTRAERVIDGAKSLADLGTEIAPGIYDAELRYLRDAEWATCAQDVLWRRSKLGLHVAPGTLDAVTAAVDAWFAAAHAPHA